jgi:hypothetical protein
MLRSATTRLIALTCLSCLFASWPIAALAQPSKAAQDVMVADLRRFRPAAVARVTSAERRLLTARAASASQRMDVAGKLGGRFTSAEVRQTLYLLRPNATGAPRAGVAEARAPILTTGLVTAARGWPLTEPYPNALERAFDIDGDGIDEIVLRTDVYQMGVSSVRVGVVSLAGGSLRVLVPMTEVFSDTCDSPVGERRIESKTLRWRADGAPEARFVFEDFERPCAPTPSGR